VGAPVLLTDSGSKPAQAEPFLALSSASDATRFGVARGQRTQLVSDPALAGSELLAVKGSQFLTQRARGRSVELSVLACQPGSWLPP